MNWILKRAEHQALAGRGRQGIFWTAILGVSAIALGHVEALEAQIVAPPSGGKWVQTYDDEFNAGSLDLAGWTYDVGGGGWGNSELETYTNSPSNAFVSGGNLNINVIASGTGANETYTSARIRSSGLFSQTYGLFEFTAKMPVGTGLWPAVWMAPENSLTPTGIGSTVYGKWPYSGEIDVDESPNLSPNPVYPNGTNNNLVHAAIHYEGSSGATQQQGIYSDPPGFTTAAWHTYDFEWNAPSGSTLGTMTWYCDGNAYLTVSSWNGPENSGSDKEAPFDQPFYLMVNMAVGGNFGGTNVPNLADGSYDFQVGYIKAFEDPSVGAAPAVAVPEPAASAVFLLATMGLIRHRRRRVVEGT